MVHPLDLADRCMLNAGQDGSPPCEPLGLIAWELQPGAREAAHLSSLIPERADGRDLFLAGWEDAYVHLGQRWSRAWPTVPLLVRATPRSLQVLFRCAPSEAAPLGQRLALMGEEWLNATGAWECAPAVLADLCQRYLRADPGLAALTLQDGEPPRLAPWTRAWPAERILLDERGEPLPPLDLSDEASEPAAPEPAPAAPARAPLAGRLRARLQRLPQLGPCGTSQLMAYALGRPTLLVPVCLALGSAAGAGAEAVLARSRAALDASLLAGVVEDSLYRRLPVQVSRQGIEVLVPLRADNWRAHLTQVRDEVQRRLAVPAGYVRGLQPTCGELLRELAREVPGLLGSDQVYTSWRPAPGRRLDRVTLIELLARLSAVVGAKLEPALVMGAGHRADPSLLDA